MLPTLLLNVLKSLIIDKAQSLAVEHVKSALSQTLNPDDMASLDKAIDEDKSHSFNNLSDFLTK